MAKSLTRSALTEQVAKYRPDPEYHDEEVGLACCQLALQALQAGNYGVAALLLNPDDQVLLAAPNRVFTPCFNSAAHAEMQVVDQLEAEPARFGPRDQLKLLVSLEPCPMCLARLLLSGIGIIKYLAPDPVGGMVQHRSRMPAAFRNLAQLQDFYPAHVSPALRQLAAQLAQCDQAEHRRQLLQSRIP